MGVPGVALGPHLHILLPPLVSPRVSSPQLPHTATSDSSTGDSALREAVSSLMSQLKSLTTRMNALETQYRDFTNKHSETAATVVTLSEGQLAMITSIATLTEKI